MDYGWAFCCDILIGHTIQYLYDQPNFELYPVFHVGPVNIFQLLANVGKPRGMTNYPGE